MPRGDRTGPRGLGPLTGRAAGYCAGYPTPGFMNPAPRGYGRGIGRGYGRGRGMGFRRGYGRVQWLPMPQHQYENPPPIYPPMSARQSPEEECTALENYKKNLEAERADLEQEMNDVEASIKELRSKLEQGKSKP